MLGNLFLHDFLTCNCIASIEFINAQYNVYLRYAGQLCVYQNTSMPCIGCDYIGNV